MGYFDMGEMKKEVIAAIGNAKVSDTRQGTGNREQ
jgi:hypothetical protein